MFTSVIQMEKLNFPERSESLSIIMQKVNVYYVDEKSHMMI